MKIIKKITAILLLIIGLLVVGSAALADDTEFDKVKVDGVDVTGTTKTVYAERGEILDVYVEWTAGTDPDVDREDLKLKAEISGYDDDIEDVINLNDMDPGDTISKTLHVFLPEDMDAREEYTLHVSLSNKKDIDIEEEYSLKISQEKHKLSIQDVTIRQSGGTIFATVRVENIGYKKEEDIKVIVSIPDLGVSAKSYIDELVAVEDDEDDGETSGSTPEMKLTIPEDAKAGTYNVKITVTYDKDRTVEETETVSIKAVESTTTEEVPATLVNIDSSSKEATAGVEVPFKIMIANLGNEAAIYSVEVAGADLWAVTRVEPVMITLSPNAYGEILVYVKPKTDIEAGKHGFTAKVKSGNMIVAEKTLTTDVTGTTSASTATSATTNTSNGQTNFASLKNALVIGFGVLVVLLVILGLIIAFNKMSKDEDEEIPGNNEGQAYY